MDVTQSENEIIKSMTGDRYDPAAFEVINDIKEVNADTYTVATLPSALSQLDEGEVAVYNTDTQFTNFKIEVNDQVRNKFQKKEKSSAVTAYKWEDVFWRLLVKFGDIEKVMLTEGYKFANLSNCKVNWSFARLVGGPSVQYAAKIFKDVFMGYLTKKKLVSCLTGNEDNELRDVYIKIQELIEGKPIETFEQYLTDSTEYWIDVEVQSSHKLIENHETSMRKKFSLSMIKFMESQGFPVYTLWYRYGPTKLGKTILRMLEEQYAKYRANPHKKSNGVLSFIAEVKNSNTWKDGNRDHGQSATNEIEQKKRKFHGNFRIRFSLNASG